MSEITQMDIINANIEYGARGTDNKTITKNILAEYRGSDKIKAMQDAFQYYIVNNTEISKKTRSYQDEDGKIIINNSLTNTKTKSAQYRKSVNQKVNFSLSKPFVISCDNDKYQQAWEEWLDDTRRKVIKRAGKEAINKGICFVYPWIDEKGELNIAYTIPETMYPAWRDIDHTELDAMVRDYVVTEYINETARDVYKVEYWDSKIFEKFIDYGQGEGNGDLVDDIGDNQSAFDENENVSIINTHMKTKDGKGKSWERVPFIPIKGNEDELPLLAEMKTDIDSYDMLKSKSIDSLADDIDAVLVVENISAELGELSKARRMVQNSRIMALEPGGKAHFEKVDANISAIKEELELIKKDMQDNTSTVDLTTIQLGTNPSGESMKSFFESLNTWTNGFEEEFRVFMKNLKYFFDMWLSWKGGYGTFEQLQAIPITFTLDRDMMINESGIITNLMQLRDELSQQTRDEMNPWVESHEIEQARRDEEEKAALEKGELLLKQKENEEEGEFENEEREKDNLSDEEKEENKEKIK